jgi:hypothetical protein
VGSIDRAARGVGAITIIVCAFLTARYAQPHRTHAEDEIREARQGRAPPCEEILCRGEAEVLFAVQRQGANE